MKLVLITVVSLVFCCGVFPQSHTQSPGTIDGWEHPELIPDIVAYRHWYQVTSHSKAQTVRLQATGLSEADQAQMVKALNSFAVQWDALTANWHNQNVAANGAVDNTAYNQAKADLVNQTNKEVQGLLSPAGWAQFQAYIKAHKRWMKMSSGVTI